MQFSLSIEYAIHGIVYLAMHSNKEIIFVDEVARAQNISTSYLSKIFHQLAKHGILHSYRGAKGGYGLAMDPAHITFRRIFEVIEGKALLFNCLEDKRLCNLGINCIIRNVLTESEQKLYESLEKTTIADVLKDIQNSAIQPEWLNQLEKKLCSDLN